MNSIGHYIEQKIKEGEENPQSWEFWPFWLCVIMAEMKTIPICECGDLLCTYKELRE